MGLQLGTSDDEGLASFVVGELLEVLDEASGEVLGLGFPFASAAVGVARIEDLGIDTGESGGNFEIEVRNLLGGSLLDGAVEDSVDDAAGILDGDTFAGAIPAGVDEVSLSAGFFHAFYEFLGILGGVELQEGLAEASAEGGSGLGDAALGTSQLSGEAGEEVVLGLLGSEDADGRQHAESIGREEDNIVGSGSGAHGADDLLDVLDGIRDAGVLGNALISEVDFAVGIDGNVLEESVAADGVVDVGFGVFVEVDNLGIAAALEVEDALVVPAVLIVANEEAFGIGGKVVLPVPERPKKMAVCLPSISVLAEQCIEAIPWRGR